MYTAASRENGVHHRPSHSPSPFPQPVQLRTFGLPPADLQANAICPADSATVFVCSRSVVCCCCPLVREAAPMAQVDRRGMTLAKAVTLWPRFSASSVAAVLKGLKTAFSSSNSWRISPWNSLRDEAVLVGSDRVRAAMLARSKSAMALLMVSMAASHSS